ncbi:PadR family transcriptional regulator [Amorphus orientalis]|uniref:DNA-binding PadR family transcriptional regulator n=1 Tax=Amorphus orientalis TaxID=649198 RepID=A0AAE3VQ77_9HYPH|nr:PadR family transcriptional regulator [Amorphus orientalis]MDQ0316264.1 DNA-binding PadR family transcriptional regulator [Amorphus orientalis]
MNVRTLCLAILQAGDTTGYDIKKMSVEGKYSYFVDASFGSIYPALARLEADGLVTVREEAQSGKPARKVYSITDAGREALIRELTDDPEPDVFRSPFLLVAMNAELLSRGQLVRVIEARIAEIRGELDHLASIAAGTDHAGAHWICRYGQNCMKASLDFLEANRAELEAMASGEAEDTAQPAARAAVR